MTKLYVAAALALLSGSIMTSDTFAADGWAPSAYDVILNTTLAQFAGNQKYNRCPRFRVIDEATRAELATVGKTADMLTDPGEMIRGDGTPLWASKYNEDPSAFCKMAWELLGPNGSYKRQMLEAK